jgi:hypothetical protein
VRDTTDPVEEEGVRRALQAAADADLCVLVLDAVADQTNTFQWLGARSTADSRGGAPPLWVVYNKMDLMTAASEAAGVHAASGQAQRTYEVSCRTGDGVAQFLHALQVLPYPPRCLSESLFHPSKPQPLVFPDVAMEGGASGGQEQVQSVCDGGDHGGAHDVGITRLRHRAHLQACRDALHRYVRVAAHSATSSARTSTRHGRAGAD